jgi:hypothetical protein
MKLTLEQKIAAARRNVEACQGMLDLRMSYIGVRVGAMRNVKLSLQQLRNANTKLAKLESQAIGDNNGNK